jgi:hypothetical protein
MNSIIRFKDAGLFVAALTVLELDATPEYEVDGEALAIHTNDEYAILDILESNGIFMFEVESNDGESSEPNDDMDGDHESALASAGFGVDESYGDYGSDTVECLGDES